MTTTYYTNKNTIYFLFTCHGKQIVKSTSLKINSSLWGSGFPKQKKETAALRNILSGYKIKIDNFIAETANKQERQPTKFELHDFINILLGKQKRSTNVSDLIDWYLERYCVIHKRKKTNQTNRIHLENFRSFTKNLEINDLNIDVFENYTYYLVNDYRKTNGENLEVVTINSYLKDVKALFNKLYEKEKVSIKFGDKKYIKLFKEKSKPIIALTEDELSIIESSFLPFPKLQRVVDLFLFGCYTALRFEDLNEFTIVEGPDGAKQIRISKTGSIINIPLIAESLAILEKYNYKLPKISNQKANEYLKSSFKYFGLNRLVYVDKVYVNDIVTIPFKLYDTISFHKSRKTFITTALRRGISKRIVMQLADIKSESVFKKYDDYNNKEGNEAMQDKFSQGRKQPTKLSFKNILQIILEKEKDKEKEREREN